MYTNFAVSFDGVIDVLAFIVEEECHVGVKLLPRSRSTSRLHLDVVRLASFRCCRWAAAQTFVAQLLVRIPLALFKRHRLYDKWVNLPDFTVTVYQGSSTVWHIDLGVLHI